MDAIVISDIHLGSAVCQAELLTEFLKTVNSTYLILNGDVFNDLDFRRLRKHHWHVLSQIRKLADHVRVIWIAGNHDGSAELISHLLGVSVADEFSLWSGTKHVYFHHGHRYDKFIAKHPRLTRLADFIYWILQKIDPTFRLARNAKQQSKTFLRNSATIEKKSLEYARKHGYHAVCTGHTHYPLAKPGAISYYNSGCWTELPCSYLTVENGVVTLNFLQ